MFIVCSLALLASVAYTMSAPVNKWLGVESGSRVGSRVTNSILKSRYSCDRRASRALELFMTRMEVRRPDDVALGTFAQVLVLNFCD